jgi:glycosyltransferase involved in cell wall biosynthesis
MVLKGYPRISETFISNEILSLERMGQKVHIFSMREPRERFTHKSVQAIRARVDYLPETLLEPLPLFLRHNALLWLKAPRRYQKALALTGRRFARSRKSATIKHLLQAGYLVHALLPGSGVCHLHAHFAHSPTSVAMFASALSGLPFSFFAHAKDIYTTDPAQLKEKITKARFVATCTGYNQEYLKKLAGRFSTPVRKVYHGIDLSLFDPKSGQRLNPKPPYRIFSVARMVEKKGLPTVFRALKILEERGMDFIYTLIGSGELKESMRALSIVLGLADRTRFLGTRPHEEVIQEYEKSDLFVLGCQIARNGDRDGIPNVLVESLAMGVPVAATRVSAIPELIVNGETGLLAPPEDPEALANAMERLLLDPELRERVIQKGKEKVAREFDHKALSRELMEVYRAGGAFGK